MLEMWPEMLVVAMIMGVTFLGSCLMRTRTRAKLLANQKLATMARERTSTTDISNNTSDILLDLYMPHSSRTQFSSSHSSVNNERNLPI